MNTLPSITHWLDEFADCVRRRDLRRSRRADGARRVDRRAVRCGKVHAVVLAALVQDRVVAHAVTAGQAHAIHGHAIMYPHSCKG